MRRYEVVKYDLRKKASLTLVVVVALFGATCRKHSSSSSIAAPSLTGTIPLSPGASATPQVQGTAVAGATVQIYGQAGCAGSVVASGKADASTGAFSIAVNAPTGTTLTLSANATASGGTSGCTASTLTYASTDFPGITTATAGTVLSASSSFDLSVPDDTGYLDLSFSEDSYLPGTFSYTQVDSSGASSTLSAGTIRFFQATPVTSSSTFVFGRLVAYQPTGGGQTLYFLGQYDNRTVTAAWTTGASAVTILQYPWGSSGELATRTATAVTDDIGVALDSKMVAAWGGAPTAALEALAPVYFVDAVYGAQLSFHLVPQNILAYLSATNDPFTGSGTDLLTSENTYFSSSSTVADSFLLESSYTVSSSELGLAYTPGACHSGTDGFYVNMNPSLVLAERVGLLAHELGHTLGFKHVETEMSSSGLCPAVAVMCGAATIDGGALKFVSPDVTNLTTFLSVPSCIN